MSDSVPQFGRAEPGRTYADRPAAFGILEREGRIAAVAVTKPGHKSWLDLPGGAIDPGEDARAAVVREYGEETGLKISVGRSLGHADQLFVNTDGQAFNNRASLFEVLFVAEEGGLKIEADHELTWLTPLEALERLRHDAHAWAVAAWLRRR